MSVPVLYGLPGSTCTRRVLVTLEEKVVRNFNLVTINLKEREQKKPEFLAKQPFGHIPVYEDDGVSIFESRAIMRFISEKYASQGTELLGESLKERALVNQWLEVESQEYNPPLQSLIWEKVIKLRYGLQTDEAKAAEAKAKFSTVLDVYERHLASREFLANDRVSMADLSHLPYTNLLFVCGEGDLILSRPGVKQWWERISSRPSWTKVAA